MATAGCSSVHDLWKSIELGLIPDQEMRRLIKIELQKRIQWGSKPTYQQQLAQLLDFIKSLRGMKMSANAGKLDTKYETPNYETPHSFQQIICGYTLKESAGLFTDEKTTLDEAHIKMMDLYCEKAKIEDGQTILDLGCGLGALVFHVAKKYKNCKITGVTDSTSQKEFILEHCKKLNLSNVEIILADVTLLEMEATFDRVFIIGLIEHMKNFELFLRKVSKWMKADGLLFLEHYCHKSFSYHLESLSQEDWLEDNLFPRGTLLIPSATCLLYFQDDVTVVDHWVLTGNHFARTQKEWLKRVDTKTDEIKEIFKSFYGISEEEATKLINFWRFFCITGDEMYGYNNGEEWMITHILFNKK